LLLGRTIHRCTLVKTLPIFQVSLPAFTANSVQATNDAIDIGAEGLRPLFIAGCCVTTIFLDLSFAAERYLRHTGRVVKNVTKAEKVLSVLASMFAGAYKVDVASNLL
jgi:hypothetical protein